MRKKPARGFSISTHRPFDKLFSPLLNIFLIGLNLYLKPRLYADYLLKCNLGLYLKINI